jgi:hypothetical protein
MANLCPCVFAEESAVSGVQACDSSNPLCIATASLHSRGMEPYAERLEGSTNTCAKKLK